MAMTPAMESIFANAQQNAASLIETATLAINAKVNTIKEAEAMIQELSSEAVKFNELLTCIMNAMRQVESGDMQKEEAAGIIAPAVKELKDKCTALKIANVEAPGDDITEDEIATLRELIIGAKAAAEDRLVAIRLCDDCKVDPEVENELNPPEENGEAFEFDPATEGIASFIQKMHDKKVNKAKITIMKDSFKDKKTETIVKSVVAALKPALIDGNTGLTVIKNEVAEMQKADGGNASKFEGKISSFDFVVKTINGIGVAYLPGDLTTGTGLSMLLVPAKNKKGQIVADTIIPDTAAQAILNPIKESEVTEAMEAFEFDPATEGIASFIQKMHTKKVNKAKVTVLMDSLKDKKTDVIVKKVVDAMKPALVAGADGLSAIKRDVDEMQKADGGDPSKYEGKLSSFDCVVKTISGVGVGYIPDNPSEGTGLAWIAVPTKDRKGNVVGTVITVRTACEYILNPIKESEVTEAMEAYEEIAEEATILAAQYVNTTECKTAKALYQNAKKLYSMGSKEKALEYMKKAKDLYDKCLKKLLNESGKFERAERVDPIKKHGGTATIRHNVTRTDSLTFAIARSKLENKIDRCTAHILQWTTKAGKETYQQTLDQLKADREQAKAAKKAAKATENYEMEDNTMFNYDEFMFAAESYMDELQLELDTDFAMEADGVEDTSEAPSTIANKLRSALAKFKSAFKRGDKAAAEEAQKEVEAAADEMAAAEDGADEKKKSGLSKAAKIGLTAAGTVAAVAGLTAAGIAISQKAKGEKVDIKGGAKAIKQTIGTAMHNFSENQKNAAASRAVGREEAKQAKLEERNRRADQYFIDQTEKGRAAQIAKDNKAAAKYNAQKVKDAKKAAKAADKLAKIQAKKAAKAAKEAFGISEFDAYEVILEAMMTAEDEFSFDDEDLAASIEAML